MSTPEPAATQRVQDLAETLRGIRANGGNPTLDALARKTGISKTVLSEAFAGRKLPSERTVAAIAHAFDADEAELLGARRALDSGTPTRQPATKRRAFGRWTVTGVAIGGLVVGGLLGATGAWTVGHYSAAHASARKAQSPWVPQIVVKDGTDPAQTKCVNDAKVAVSENRTNNTNIQIVYSSACHAAWARVQRYDGKSLGNEVTATIYNELAPNAPSRQTSTEPNTAQSYTTLIVRPSPQTELCATGSITLSGKTISLGAPICL